jgi:hypothetical protein
MPRMDNPIEAIAAAPIEAQRPRVSVMIPCYQPGPYLLDALRSVLQQDLGAVHMQIAVVDDASPSVDVNALIKQLGVSSRIEIHRSEQNRGLAGNWNRCVKLARGSVVHILHQDDVVLDGFYLRLLPAFDKRDDIGMAFCRHALADSSLSIERRSHRERWTAGVVPNWLARIVEWDCIQCPAVMVRRSAYEQLGGYRSDLVYSLDWEMWVRIAARYPVWFEPRLLAYFRKHAGSESNRLAQAGRTFSDLLKTIDVFAKELPEIDRERLLQPTYAKYLRKTLRPIERMHPQNQTNLDELLQPINEVIGRLSNARLANKSRMRVAALVDRWREPHIQGA